MKQKMKGKRVENGSESRQTDMDNTWCDICGATGFSKYLLTCFQCKRACEHVYCMRQKLKYVPCIWYCEVCRPQKRGNSEARSDLVKINSPFQKSLAPVPRNSNLKRVETRRVKYIPAEEAIMLTSGTKRKTVVGSSSQSGPSDGMTSISKRTPPVSTSLSKCFVREHNATPKKIAVRTQPPYGDRIPKHKLRLGEKLHLSNVEGREPSVAVHERPSYASSPPIESQCTRNSGGASDVDQQAQITLHEPVHLVGGASLTDSQFLKSVQEKDLALFSPRFEDQENLPALDSTWKGSFEIVDKSSCSHFYDGFRAHPPGKVSRKAYELSKQMPGILQFKLQNHSDVWAEVFDYYSPSGSDVALYFFPGDFERSIQMYNGLYTLLEMRDFAMRSCLEGVELLIFTSKKLPLDSRIKTEFYLWGVFLRGGSRFKNIRLQLYPLEVKKEEEAQEPETDELGIGLGWCGSKKSVKNEPGSSSKSSMSLERDYSELSLSKQQYMRDRQLDQIHLEGKT